MKRIVLNFDQAGGMKMEAEGFVGVSCEDATKVFENAFVSSSRTDEKKPEYYASDSPSQSVSSDKVF